MDTPASSIHEQPARWTFAQKLMGNPILAKELKGRMRGRQGFIILAAYLSLISLVIAGLYFYSTDGVNMARANPDSLQEMGKLIFSMVVMFEFLMIGLIGPALTSGAISSERERQTFDLLRTSLLSSRDLVFGKLLTTVIYLMLLVLTALPLQSLVFFLGGVGMGEMIISFVMLTATAFLFCTLGLYFSTIARRTIIATVLSYTSIFLPNIVLVFVFTVFINNIIDTNTVTDEIIVLALNSVWVLLSTNPISAGLVTQFMLVEEQSLFLIYPPDFSLVLFSPWIVYVVYSFLMTAAMLKLIVFYLDRYER